MNPRYIKDSVVWVRTSRGWRASVTVTHTPTIELKGPELPDSQRLAIEGLLRAVAKSMDEQCLAVGQNWETAIQEAEGRFKKGKQP